MKSDSRSKWCRKGELFHKYRPRETTDESKPSEWWILVYLLQIVLDVVTFRRQKSVRDSVVEGERDRLARDVEDLEDLRAHGIYPVYGR